MVASRTARQMIPFDYERVIESIDWNRILHEARAQHMRDHSPSQTDICGMCMRTVLLREEY